MSDINELKDEELEKVSGGIVYDIPQAGSWTYLNPEDGCKDYGPCGTCYYYSNHGCCWGRG